MTAADQIFERFPAFIREYIYSHGWESLRQVQIEAAKTILYTDHHLLLTSTTASGKTEAAFFPILTKIGEEPSAGISVLYVAPLKSLINDQFSRMEDLLRESGIQTTHWHGDVAQSRKKKLLDHPTGILQITPESLESMLINRPNDIPRLFAGLQFIVLDDDRVNLLKDKIRFSFWEKLDENHTVIRFVTSWSTSEEDMQALEEALEVI